MVVGEIPEAADFVVIGGGPGGYTAALHAAECGRRVTLIDADGAAGLGGVCLHTGCIPSKALIERASQIEGARALADEGALVLGDVSDLTAWQSWRVAMIEQLRAGIEREMSAGGVEIVRGVAALNRRDQVVVRSPVDDAQRPRFFQFRDLVLATGSRPVELPQLPRDGDMVLDCADALALTAVPRSVAIVGAGYIGVELGTALAKLGADVTLIETADRILPGVDAAAARVVAKRLRELGVTAFINAKASGVDAGAIHIDGPSGRSTVPVEKVVVAVGRTPNTATIGLDFLGVSTLAAGVVDVAPNRMVTDHVAAIGDITSGPALAHKATAEAFVAVDALCGRRTAFDPAAVPAVVFSDPEIAVAGTVATNGGASDEPLRVVTVPLTASGRAVTTRARLGFSRLACDSSGTVVGGMLVGPHASERIAEVVLAIEMGASIDDLALTIHPHPTVSEQVADVARRLARPARP